MVVSIQSRHLPAKPPRPQNFRSQVPTPRDIATHARLRPTLPRDAWPLWRAVCRGPLLAYAIASRNDDANARFCHLVDLLKLPAQGLIRQRGGKSGRGTRQLHGSLKALLARGVSL